MILNKIKKLYKESFSENCTDAVKLPASGSNRDYYRLSGTNKTVIAAYNPVLKENEAFIHYTQVFLAQGLKVPKVLNYNLSENIYLLEDLGDTTAFDRIISLKQKPANKSEILNLLKNIIDNLICFQTNTYNHIDFSKAFPRHSFDIQSIMWDLNYFKYYFLKLLYINFDEQLLEDDFNAFARFLNSAENKYFMYRDFQSRNIMIKEDNLYFIDYQGGRKGPLQYDLASLLYSAQTGLEEDIRDELLQYYINQTKGIISVSESQNFTSYYYAFVLVRILQALGAYGYRGIFERKAYFINSIPLAIANLKVVLEKLNIPIELQELNKCLNEICACDINKKLILRVC